MKKIIVPVDFSDHSNYALEAASILAKKYNAEILALHMLEISETILTKGEADLQDETVFFRRDKPCNFIWNSILLAYKTQ